MRRGIITAAVTAQRRGRPRRHSAPLIGSVWRFWPARGCQEQENVHCQRGAGHLKGQPHYCEDPPLSGGHPASSHPEVVMATRV